MTSSALPEVRKAKRRAGFAASLLAGLGIGLLVLVTAFAVSWSFGFVAFENTDARELFSRTVDGRADVRRGASIEWARRLQEVEEKGRDIDSLRPTDIESARLAGEFRAASVPSTDPIRLAALASILGHARDPQISGETLCAFLDHVPPESFVEAQVHALLALRRLQRPCPPVARLAPIHPDPSARKAAALALGAGTPDAEAVAALERLLLDPSADVRWNAAFALASNGHASAKPTILALLDEVNASANVGAPIVDTLRLELFAATLRAALQLKDAAIRSKVEAIAKSHPSVRVRSLALSALN